MNSLFTWYRYSRNLIRGWFKEQRGPKLLVLAVFLLLGLLIMSGIYVFAFSFFMMLAAGGKFGLLVATYAFNVGFILMILLLTLMSALSLYGRLFNAPELTHWFTLPLSSKQILFKRMAETVIQSLFFSSLVLFPVASAFARAFALPTSYLSRTGLVMTLLTLITESLSLGLIFLIHKRKRTWLLSIFFILMMYLIVKIAFPPEFTTLNQLADESLFNEKFQALTFNRLNPPTLWLAKTLTQGIGREALKAIGLTLVLLAGVWLYSAKRYGVFFQEHKALRQSETESQKHFPVYKSVAQSLITHEFKALFFQAPDRLYFGLTTILGLLFVLLIGRIPLPKAHPELLPILYTIIISGLGYLMTVMSLRLIYPLLAREKRTAWWLFTKPLPKSLLLDSKLGLTLLLTLPFMLLTILAVSTLTLPYFNYLMILVLTLTMIITIGIANFCSGVIFPVFAEADNPETMSTSMSGLFTLGQACLVIMFTAWTLNQLLGGKVVYLFTYMLLMGLLTAVLMRTAFHFSKKMSL